MNSHSIIEMKTTSIAKSIQQQLTQANQLIEEIKKEVKINQFTEKELDDLSKIVNSLLAKFKSYGSENKELQNCTRQMLEYFTKLGNGLLDNPKKFTIMNQDHAISKIFNKIKSILQEIDELIEPPKLDLR